MIKSVNKRAIFKDIARKLNVSMGEVELAVSSQFSFVREVMRKGDFEQVRLPFFGRFWVKPARKAYLDRNKKAKEERLAKLKP